MSEKDIVTDDKLSEAEIFPTDMLAAQEAAYARDIERLKDRASEFVTVTCPACGSRHHIFAFEKFSFQFQKCTDCETIYMSPRPSVAVMSDYYQNSENYQFWAQYVFPASEDNRREKIHKPWLHKILGYCAIYDISKDRLVEVGPGFGTFSELASKSGEFGSVVAIEPTPDLAESCRARGVEVVEKRVESAREVLAGASVVVSFEVIEHLYDPNEFLSALSEGLPDGALLVLSCPNGKGFDIGMLQEKSLAVDSEHVNLFNPDSLSLSLGRHGFRILECTTPGRLDAEFVREAALKGDVQLDAFHQEVLIERWDELGWPFQQFLAENKMSSHMWIVAQKGQ